MMTSRRRTCRHDFAHALRYPRQVSTGRPGSEKKKRISVLRGGRGRGADASRREGSLSSIGVVMGPQKKTPGYLLCGCRVEVTRIAVSTPQRGGKGKK